MPFDERPLRTFLFQVPKPARIVVQTDEGPHEIGAAGPGTGKTWASVARTILAMQCSRIECYDASNKLLRALGEESEESKRSFQPTALTIPNADPETQRLLHFANLLYRATEFSTTLAFEKMCDLFERVTDRSDAIEQRLERTEAAYRRTLNEQVRDALEQAAEQEPAPGADNPLQEILQAFAGGVQAGRRNNANGKPESPA